MVFHHRLHDTTDSRNAGFRPKAWAWPRKLCKGNCRTGNPANWGKLGESWEVLCQIAGWLWSLQLGFGGSCYIVDMLWFWLSGILENRKFKHITNPYPLSYVFHVAFCFFCGKTVLTQRWDHTVLHRRNPFWESRYVWKETTSRFA